MSMKTLGFISVTLALMSLPTMANAQNDSARMGRGMPNVGMPAMPSPSMPRPSMPGGMMHNGGGQWAGAMRAPGGMGGYRAPVRGYQLPSYWINPSFYVGNYAQYGFAAPRSGYGWSRYYDDAVMTDRYGRVYDSVRGVNWNDGGDYGEDYSDSYGYRDDGGPRYDRTVEAPRRKPTTGIVGGIIGGVVGAIAGNVIAGPGNRLAGSLIGGGLGAIAGTVIEGSQARRNGRYEGSRGGQVYAAPRGRDLPYDQDYRSGSAHWDDRGGNYPDDRRSDDRRVIYRGGNYGGGYTYGGGGETIVTIQSAPATMTTTTTTTYVTEQVRYVAAPRRRVAVRKAVWRPRPQPRCTCGS
jgi:Ni/Co efflux regulator RcnB